MFRGQLRETAGAALAACVLAVVMTWPLAAHIGTQVPANLQDPLLQAWQVAWDGHALLHQPLHFFQANAFWPARDSLAFSDALVGYAPVGLIGSGPEAALVRYDVLFLFASALAFLGAYLLVRELGARPGAATVAGIAFAYAPWRLTQSAHLHVLSSGGVPLSLYLLLRGYRRGRPGLVIAGGLVATWQLTLGFTLGLQLSYLLLVLAVLFAAGWVRRGRPRLDRGLLLASAGGAVLLLAVGALLARPYLRVADAHPEARRTLAEVKFYSPPAKGLLAAPGNDRVWGGVSKRILGGAALSTEDALFPGAALLLLALLGLGARSYSRRLRAGLLAAVLITAVLSLGFRVAGDLSPYRLLYELAPGWQAVRTPGRLTTLTLLALALLAAAGAQRLIHAAEDRRRPAGWILAALLSALVLLEGSGRVAHPVVPKPPAGYSLTAAPQLHLPSSVIADPLYMYWSTDSFRALVNGYSGFDPRSLVALRALSARFPDGRSVAYLRRLGVSSVVVHPDLPLAALARGTPQQGVARLRAIGPWRAAAARPVAGLPLRRRAAGGVVIFDLLARASAHPQLPPRNR